MDFHRAGVSAKSREIIEKVSPKFLVQGMKNARKKTILAMKEIQSGLKEGMTEKQARDLAMKVFRDHGAVAHWHKPYIRFGKGTTLTFHQLLQTKERLKLNDPYYVDFGPVWKEGGISYEADYGDSFVFGENKEYLKLVKKAHRMFSKAKKYWKKEKVSGVQIYKYLKKLSKEEGVKLLEDVDGHRLSNFSHFKYSKKHLSEVKFYPTKNLWILELQINDPAGRFGAFYEDLLA